MSKFINSNNDIEKKLRQSYEKFLEDCSQEFEEKLKNLRLADGKFTFSKTFCEQFDGTDEKARVILTPLAYLKTELLLEHFDKEVAWHGVAHRREEVEDGFEGIFGEPTKNDYIISDIFVYPQSTSPVHVDMDESEYAVWLMESYDNPRMKNLRMKAHSHVNMDTTPSSDDINSQKIYLNQLPDDGFYIFMIWNKRFENNIKIYDLKKNILFENKDITLEISDKECSLYDFLPGAKKMVKDLQTGYEKSKVTSPTSIIPSSKSRRPAKRYPCYDGEDYDFNPYYEYMSDYYENY